MDRVCTSRQLRADKKARESHETGVQTKSCLLKDAHLVDGRSQDGMALAGLCTAMVPQKNKKTKTELDQETSAPDRMLI